VAQKPPEGTDAASVTTEAIRVRATIDLSEFGNRLQNETARLIADYSQQGLTGEALADAVIGDLESMFDAGFERAGREATHEAFSLGRNLEAQAQAPKIGDVVRSEILDSATCAPCETKYDGLVVQMNTPDYFTFMPPNGCEGREQCRGIYIYRSAA